MAFLCKWMAFGLLFASMSAFADENGNPITCGRPIEVVRLNPILGLQKVKIKFEAANLHTHFESENTWKETKTGDVAITITLHKKFSEQLDALRESAESARKYKLRFCIQDENPDDSSALGKRYASGPTESEAIAETVSR